MKRKVTVFSSEYPQYTGQSSEFDDVVTWGIKGPTSGQTKGPHSYNVNSLHSQFGAGPFAGGNVVVDEGVLDYSIAAASSASYLHLTGTAVNVSDNMLGSGVAIQVAVIKVEIDSSSLERPGYPHGIPLGQYRDVTVTIEPDLSGTGYYIEFDVFKTDPDAGNAYIDSSTRQLTSSGTIRVYGGANLFGATKASVGPKLKIEARLNEGDLVLATSVLFATCTHIDPNSFDIVDSSECADGVLMHKVEWHAETATPPLYILNGDLDNVYVGEYIDLQGSYPNPPFQWPAQDPDPTILPRVNDPWPIGPNGYFIDRFFHNYQGGDCVVDGTGAEHQSVQYYRTRCFRCQPIGTDGYGTVSADPNDANWGVILDGPTTIFRFVEFIYNAPNTSYWRYRISRAGEEAIMNDLPICKYGNDSICGETR